MIASSHPMRRSLRIGCFLFLTLAAYSLFSLSPAASHGQIQKAASALARLKIEAKERIFKPKMGVLYLYGNVKVTYDKTELTCDKAVLFQKDNELYLGGNVTVRQGHYLVRCDEAFYNYSTKQGLYKSVTFKNHRLVESLKDADPNALKYDDTPMHITSKEGHKINDDTYMLKGVTYSSCDIPNSGWRGKAKSAKYVHDKSITTYGNVLYLGPVPVFYWPKLHYSFEGSSVNGPWLRASAGSSNTWGWYTLTRWGYDISKRFFVFLDLDYRSDLGSAAGIGARLRDDRMRGDYHLYSSRERRQEEDNGPVINRDNRWRAKLEHKQGFADFWGLQVQVNTQNDRDVLKDYFRKEDNRQSEQETSAALFRNGPQTYFELFTRGQINEWQEETEYLPEARLTILPYHIPYSELIGDLYYNGEARLGIAQRAYAQGSGQDDVESARGDMYHEIYKSIPVAGILSSQVYSGVRTGVFSERANREEETISRSLATYGGQMTFRAYGIYHTQSEKHDINSLRHVIEPQLKFAAISDPTTDADQLHQFDEVDAYRREHRLTFQLNNLLQTKRRLKADQDPTSWDLMDWRLFQHYYPHEGERPTVNNTRAFSNLFSEFEWRYNYYLNGFFDLEYDRYRQFVQSFEHGVTLYSKDDRYAARFEQRFERDDFNQLVASLTYKLTPLYRTGFRIKHDLEDPDAGEFGIALARSMSCWTVITAFEYDRDDHEKKISVDLQPNFQKRDNLELFTLWED